MAKRERCASCNIYTKVAKECAQCNASLCEGCAHEDTCPSCQGALRSPAEAA